MPWAGSLARRCWLGRYCPGVPALPKMSPRVPPAPPAPSSPAI
ncbi:hypothetical protein HX91_1529, partial [Mycobacterium tuberculosis]